MKEINYRQDFPLWQRFFYETTDENGEMVYKDFGIPPWDFTIYYWTASRANPYVASVKYSGGVPACTNCKIIDGKLLVIFDNHKLSPGELRSEIVIDVPNDLYPDGFRNDPWKLHTDIRLVHGNSTAPTRSEAKAILPYIVGKNGEDGKDGKDGKDFNYNDLTEEQKDELAKKVAENIETEIPDIGDMEDISDEFFQGLFRDE